MVSTPSPKLNKDNNPGGARWCDTPGHERLECTANRSRGRGECHGPAIRGTSKCKLHGGRSVKVASVIGRAEIVTAWSGRGQAAEPVDAGMAVLGMLQMSWLRANAYGELLRQQVMKEASLQPDHDGLEPGGPVHPSGLIGYHFGAAGRDGTIYAVSEEIRALVKLESDERDRVVKYAKTAHDMGISEKITKMAERWGDVVAGRITAVLGALELTREQELMVPALLQIHLGQIDVMSLGSPE